MREEPGAAEGEPGDLGGGEEAGEAGVGGWAGRGGEEGGHAGGHGGCGVRGAGEGAEGVGAGDGGGGGAVGGDDDEGEEGVGQEGGDGEDEQGEGRDAGGAFPGEVDVGGGEVRVGGEIGVHVELADVGGDVEEEGEPADPVEELGFADFADLGVEALHGVEDLVEEAEDAEFLFWGWTFGARVSFADADAGEEDGAAEGEACYDA